VKGAVRQSERRIVVAHSGGLPVLSAQPGQFLLKDLVLMGVAIWTLGDSLRAGLAPGEPVRLDGHREGELAITHCINGMTAGNRLKQRVLAPL
jgi:hypothetical protein